MAQTLAGRTAVFRLLPLTLGELADAARPFDLWREVRTGAFPRLRERALEPGLFHSSYLATFLERDLGAQVQVRDLAGDRVTESYLVFGGEDRGAVDGVELIGFDGLGALPA